MNKKLIGLTALIAMGAVARAQDIKTKDVPAVVKEALAKKYPAAAKVS